VQRAWLSGSAKEYLIAGHTTGSFALPAFPATWAIPET
jgi:hypothetical protein